MDSATPCSVCGVVPALMMPNGVCAACASAPPPTDASTNIDRGRIAELANEYMVVVNGRVPPGMPPAKAFVTLVENAIALALVSARLSRTFNPSVNATVGTLAKDMFLMELKSEIHARNLADGTTRVAAEPTNPNEAVPSATANVTPMNRAERRSLRRKR